MASRTAAAPARTRRSCVPELRLPRSTIALLVFLQLAGSSALALTAVTLDVSVAAGVYRVKFDALLDAPVEGVARVLTDYVAYASLDPRIRSSEVVGTAPDGAPLVKTRIRACAGFFCRDVRRVERVTFENGALVARALPERSDLRSSVARTEWRAEGDRTRVTYEAEFTPDFWVPAVISRGYAGRMLRESVLELFENVEEQARGP
jgi:hypothetical protein